MDSYLAWDEPGNAAILENAPKKERNKKQGKEEGREEGKKKERMTWGIYTLPSFLGCHKYIMFQR